MHFDGDTVRAVAALARLEISEEEAGQFASELGRVLDYVEQLGPEDHAPAESGALRCRDDVVTSAPAPGGLVRVPIVLGASEG